MCVNRCIGSHLNTVLHTDSETTEKRKTRKVIEYQISATVKIINNTMCNQEIMKHKEHFIYYDINIFWN